jgi:hypothetical protein
MLSKIFFKKSRQAYQTRPGSISDDDDRVTEQNYYRINILNEFMSK